MRKCDVAVLVHACDRYALLFQGFEFFFNKHWDKQINCNYYFATEELDAAVQSFQNIKSGKGEWSDRLRFLLQNKITEKYVLYLQEDMWFTKDIHADFFNQLFEMVEQNNWMQVKLHSADIYKTTLTNHFIKGFNVAGINNKQSRYLMSHQVTLWNREYLIAQLLPNENPWRNENRGSKRLKKLNPEIFHIDYFSQNHSQPINNNEAAAVRSNFHTVSINSMLNEEVLHYTKILSEGTAQNKEYADKLLYNFNHSLTHDGLEKPRQDDIFKKTKKLFLRTFFNK